MTQTTVAMSTLQPHQSTLAIVWNGLAGLGFGGPVVLIIAGVQLSTPQLLIATGTAVVTSTRAVAGSMFTAIFAAALTTRLSTKIPTYVAAAALKAGLPETSLRAFVGAIATQNIAALHTIPGANPAIIGAALVAVKQALADSYRVVYIIGAPFALLGTILSFFVEDLAKTMNYRVDAPMEEMHAKRDHETVQ